MRRFVNADEYLATGQGVNGHNAFLYCGNNPVNRQDGYGDFWHLAIGAIVGAVLGGVSSAISSYQSTGQVNLGAVLIGSMAGAISGFVGATSANEIAQAAVSGVVAVTANIATQMCVENKSFSEVKLADAAIDGTVAAAASLCSSFITHSKVDSAKKLVEKGDKKLSASLRYKKGSSQYNKAIKKGTYLLEEGADALQKAQCASSVIGSTLGFAATLILP